MSTSKSVLSDWFDRGKAKGMTHMIVVCDTFDHSDYPVYVSPGEDAREVAKQYNDQNMQRIMECYSLSRDKAEQMAEHRANHYD